MGPENRRNNGRTVMYMYGKVEDKPLHQEKPLVLSNDKVISQPNDPVTMCGHVMWSHNFVKFLVTVVPRYCYQLMIYRSSSQNPFAGNKIKKFLKNKIKV